MNYLLTSILDMKTPNEKLFQQPHNYKKKLQIFGCVCNPWLKPYVANKLDP